MNDLLLLCSIAILATVYAISPGLSESFYMQATGTETIIFSGTITTPNITRYNVAVDTTRLLSSFDFVSTTNGVETYEFSITSWNDYLTYTNLNGNCTIVSLDPIGRISDVNVLFGEFDTGVEDPIGTITYTKIFPSGSDILVTVNGLPTSLTRIVANVIALNLNIQSYTNSAPPFSVFVLPEACSNFTCDFCYSLAAGVASSFLLMLAALTMFLFSTV